MATGNSMATPFATLQAVVTFVSAVVGVIASIYAFNSKVVADDAADRASKFKQELEQQANVRAEHESLAKFDAIAYEAVVKVLENPRANSDVAEKRERAVMALIRSTASGPMQEALFEVISRGESITASVRTEAGKVAEVLREESAALVNEAPTKLLNHEEVKIRAKSMNQDLLKGFRVVFFYCQNAIHPRLTQTHRELAEALVAELRREANADSTGWEVKELPEILNSSPGYGIRSNQIRFNPLDNEEAPSLRLKARIEDTSTAKSGKLVFERRVVNQRTPSYLSVFLCSTRINE